MKAKEVALRLYQRMREFEMEWLLDRDRLTWARIIIAKPIECFGCGGTIKEREFGDLLCVDFAFRKFCLEVFCEFCSRQMKRNNSLVSALYEVHLNGVSVSDVASPLVGDGCKLTVCATKQSSGTSPDATISRNKR